MHPSNESRPQKTVIGWREWIGLPGLGLDQIKVKVDTGARSSALHAFEIEQHGDEVFFNVHPHQKNNEFVVACRAMILDTRRIRDSGGREEDRIVIRTPVTLGGQTWDIDLTLTSRDDMRFRMLLGRSAIQNKYVVDSSKSYLVSRSNRGRHTV
jgi:hypothetical protein